MKGILYRRASIKDLPILYDLSVEFEQFNKEKSTRPHEHFFGDWENYFVTEIKESLKKRNSYVFLAIADDQPAGYIFARLCRGCYAFIVEELFVGPGFAGLGIGTKLLDLVIAKGKTFNYDIKVEVFDWNTHARDYYLKRGFFVESVVLKIKNR
ncbi:GNAT family N-acetyltransferase [Patescibacteria group bacterium]|nr:GNAT family N-acetyltransferase [Patescibacteria group bacterium]MBU1970727.1 GNAT family N-acetyltransferase [Patescibacteria group bacterium]